MAFGQAKQLGEVIKQAQLRYEEQIFPVGKTLKAPTLLRNEIEFNTSALAYNNSEAFICETIIFPVLKSVWAPFQNDFALWSHQTIRVDDDLTGTPDYLIAKRSALGKIVMDAPYIAVVEAKKDDFSGGWAQCGIEMYAMQKLNGQPELCIFGIVSNGAVWQFASLQGDLFLRYTQQYTLDDLNKIFTILTRFLEKAKAQIQGK